MYMTTPNLQNNKAEPWHFITTSHIELPQDLIELPMDLTDPAVVQNRSYDSYSLYYTPAAYVALTLKMTPSVFWLAAVLHVHDIYRTTRLNPGTSLQQSHIELPWDLIELPMDLTDPAMMQNKSYDSYSLYYTPAAYVHV